MAKTGIFTLTLGPKLLFNDILRAFPAEFKIKVVIDWEVHLLGRTAERDFYIDIACPSYHNKMNFLERCSDEKETISQVGYSPSYHPRRSFRMCWEGEGCQDDYRGS